MRRVRLKVFPSIFRWTSAGFARWMTTQVIWTARGFGKYRDGCLFVCEVRTAASGTLNYSEEAGNEVVLQQTLGEGVTKLLSLRSSATSATSPCFRPGPTSWAAELVG